MIVLEGPDGAGKTTLLTHLQKLFPYIDTHERFSTSEGGPVDSLDVRIATDMNSMWSRKPQFYDRHPFISEFIYGPILRSEIKDGLNRLEMKTFRDTFYQDSLIILCLPPAYIVDNNVRSDTVQMPGVLSHIGDIYNAYHNFHKHSNFPNDNLVWYDYTQHTTGYLEQQILSYYQRKAFERGFH